MQKFLHWVEKDKRSVLEAPTHDKNLNCMANLLEKIWLPEKPVAVKYQNHVFI